MDVYQVPVGRDRHELYCEVPDSPDDEVPQGDEQARGFFRRLHQRFRDMLAEAERERRQPHAAKPEVGWLGHVKRKTLRWVAESIAEQRLLWLLPIGGSRASNAFLRTKRVCGNGPSEASTSSMTPSTIARVRSTSPPKSAWPGVSTILIFTGP